MIDGMREIREGGRGQSQAKAEIEILINYSSKLFFPQWAVVGE